MHITTRANLQIRELRPRDIIKVLVRLQELGLTSRGAGADNIRNITASPNSGFDPDELIDVRPFARGLHHYILNHRDLFGLPRKFNVAFDNGGSLSTAADTNDIGFTACRVSRLEKSLGPEAGPGLPDPKLFPRHLLPRANSAASSRPSGDFAQATPGLLIKPSDCVAVAAAMLRVFNEHGDRTNRKKARLKYLLEKWGVEKFLGETQKKLAFPLAYLPLTACEPRRPHLKHGWLGDPFRQAQARDLNYHRRRHPCSARLTSRARCAAWPNSASTSSTARASCASRSWQSFLIPHVPDAALAETTRSAGLVARGLFYTEASLATGGIIACTGNKGCKYSAADTKSHAAALMETRSPDPSSSSTPCRSTFHFTVAAPHSCAQHYCGDIGLVGAKLTDGSEGYHVVLGGGMGHEQGIARRRDRPRRALPRASTIS